MTRSETYSTVYTGLHLQRNGRNMGPLRPAKRKPKAIFILDEETAPFVYSEGQVQEIAGIVDLHPHSYTRESIQAHRQVLADIEVIISSWHMPVLDEVFLSAAHQLKLVLYAAGTVKYFLTPAMWRRGIQVSSAAHANAIPVAEFTLSQIIFALKNGWDAVRKVRRIRTYEPNRWPCAGGYRSTVGLVSLGLIGRLTCEKLRGMDVDIIAYDPTIDSETAEEYGITFCSLEDVFSRSDVISLHTPLLKETRGMINARLLSVMKENATLINTARGEIINESDLIATLKRRPDITAVLDVVCDEPAAADSELYELDNIIITPHIAGSVGKECRRMGQFMIEELKRYLSGKPLKWAIPKHMTSIMA